MNLTIYSRINKNHLIFKGESIEKCSPMIRTDDGYLFRQEERFYENP